MTLRELARQQGKSKGAIAARVDGSLRGLAAEVSAERNVEWVTPEDPDGIEIMRHSTAHVMAAAVKDLFPRAKITIGHAIENGFYYDFDVERPFPPEDLERIEEKMGEIVRADHPFVREELPKEEALARFAGEPYKEELLADIPDPVVSLYRMGNFLDLCRGPHLPSSGRVGVYKLMNTAGAYWRGDSRNRMPTRIYGCAFARKKELDEHLRLLEEVKKRDHRRLGKELDLFSVNEEIGPGLTLWHPKGANGPFHIQIYKARMRPYRDLPVRYAELGTVYRYEPSGTLHGLLRVRGFTQDDAHLFLRPDQLDEEIFSLLDFTLFVLRRFGFDRYEIYLSTRPEKYAGTPENWEKSEAALKRSLDRKGLSYEVDPGEGVFYGPKIDIKIKDVLGRRKRPPRC